MPNYKQKLTYLIMFCSCFLASFFFYKSQDYVFAGCIRNYYVQPEFFISISLGFLFCSIGIVIAGIKIAEL